MGILTSTCAAPASARPGLSHLGRSSRRRRPKAKRRHCGRLSPAPPRASRRHAGARHVTPASWPAEPASSRVVSSGPDRRALSRGLQGLAIRIARAINRELVLRGRVFADHYHARALKTPLEVKNALRYVLQSAVHHGGANRMRTRLDPCSSAASFRGWLGRCGGTATPLVSDDAVTLPRTWLLRVGWRKRGLLRARDAPS
jgi:hypothetical protein